MIVLALKILGATLGSFLSHHNVLLSAQRYPLATLHSNCRIFKLTPPNREFLSILEFGGNKLFNAHGHTFMIPVNGRSHSHQDNLGPLTYGATSPICHSGVLLCPWCCKHINIQ